MAKSRSRAEWIVLLHRAALSPRTVLVYFVSFFYDCRPRVSAERESMALKKLKSEVEEWFSYPSRGRGRYAEGIIVSLIVIISLMPVIQSYTDNPLHLNILRIIELFITSVFLVEYILRFWVAEKKLRHVINPYSIVDLIAILPLFIPGTYMQIVRVFRLLRLLRMTRFLRDRHFFFGHTTIKNLIIARIVFTLIAIIFVAAGLVYYAEHDVPGTSFQTFADAVYFSIVTMATVGYGDITPQTVYGRWVTVLIIFGGITLLPWQIKDLIEQIILSRTKRQLHCPSCDIHPHEPDAVYCRKCGAKLPPQGPDETSPSST